MLAVVVQWEDPFAIEPLLPGGCPEMLVERIHVIFHPDIIPSVWLSTCNKALMIHGWDGVLWLASLVLFFLKTYNSNHGHYFTFNRVLATPP